MFYGLAAPDSRRLQSMDSRRTVPWIAFISKLVSAHLSMYGLMTTSCGRLKELKHVHAIKSIANEAYDESETSPQDGDQSKHMDESPSYVATFMQQPGRTVVDMPLSVLVALAESLRSDSYPMDDRISCRAHRENKTTSTRTTCSPTRCATLTPSTRSTTAASWSRRTSGRGARGRRRSSCASRPARSRSVRPARRQSQTASSRSATPCCWWTRHALHGSTIIREVPPELKEFMQAKLIEDTDTVSDTL